MTAGSSRSLVPVELKDTAQWPCPDDQSMSENVRNAFLLRKQAVQMYIEGVSNVEIAALTNISALVLNRVLHRCTANNGCGLIHGFYGCLPNYRIKKYDRKAAVIQQAGSGQGGYSGALQSLFFKYPEIEEYILDLLFKRRRESTLHEARISYTQLLKQVLIKLRSLGFNDNDWPFNTKNKAYQSIVKFCKQAEHGNYSATVNVRESATASLKQSIGRGTHASIQTYRPFSHMQLDYQLVDAASIIVLTTELYGEIEINLPRWYYGILCDEHDQLVTGLYIGFESNPSTESAIETVLSSLVPEVYEKDDPRCAYILDGKVLPNQLLPDLKYHGFSSLKLDNAWANASMDFVNTVIDTVGCAVNFGPVKAWWRRALVENIFKRLSVNGLQRLPSTYGGNPVDVRKKDPDAQAEKFRILASELVGIISGAIREHNEKMSEGLFYTSAIECYTAAAEHPESGYFCQPLPKETQTSPKLMCKVIQCKVRGYIKKGIRPFIEIDRCRYTSENLWARTHLIGKDVLVYINRRDIRIAYATVVDTFENLGSLYPERRWSRYPVTIRFRKLINQSGLHRKAAAVSIDPVSNWNMNKREQLINKKKDKSLNKKDTRDHKRKHEVSRSDVLALANSANPQVFANKDSNASENVVTLAPSLEKANRFGLGSLPKLHPIIKR